MTSPHLRTAEERYGGNQLRSKYARILLGGILKGTTTTECALCGWTTTFRSSLKSQLRAHQAGNPKCITNPISRFIGNLSKEDRTMLRVAFGDFGLRWMLAGADSEDMWRADLERAREGQARP